MSYTTSDRVARATPTSDLITEIVSMSVVVGVNLTVLPRIEDRDRRAIVCAEIDRRMPVGESYGG